MDGTVHGAPPAFSNLVADGSMTHRVPMLMTREGRVTDTLPAVPFGRNQWAVAAPDGRGGFYRSQPFPDGPLADFSLDERAQIIVAREAPASADDARYWVSKIDFAGDTVFTRAFAFEPIPVRQEELDSVLREVAGFMGERGMFGLSEIEAGRLAETTLYKPAFRPGVRTVVPGNDGTILLMLEPGDAPTATWLVLDTQGEPIGRVTLPANVLVRRVDLPLLWSVETDDLDVPYVVRYRVTRSIISRRERPGATLADVTAVPQSIPRGTRSAGSSSIPHEVDS
jgi:hypothetical protein